MKKGILFILFIVGYCGIDAQTSLSLGIDCNPRLNEQEISYFNNKFAADNYDFKNKTIGFATLKVKKICGSSTIDLSLKLPITKKEYFNAITQDNCQATASKLLLLNDEQKKEAGGFDAIVLLIPKKKENKITEKTIDYYTTIFGYRTLNYPGNLSLVGNDNNQGLTDEEAVFFNTIYSRKLFDFKGKKIAFINPHLVEEKQAIRTKKEYIEKIKKHLENDFLYPTDDLEIFSEQEKEASGGYDAMIVYQSKRYYKHILLKLLKEN